MPEFQSILLVTHYPQQFLQLQADIDLTQNKLDTLIITTDKSIGIDDIKAAKRFAANPPVMSTFKHIIIPESHKLTPEAQNALLKLLEEPPHYLKIILIITNPSQLLETILSRCHIVTDPMPQADPDDKDLLLPFLKLSPPARLDTLPPTTNRETAQIFCRQLIQSAQIELHQHPSVASAHNLEILIDCETHLSQNANPTLALADAVLNLKTP